jgi:hypothetical protein
MKKLLELKMLFSLVAGLEFAYFLTCMLPPVLIESWVGWNLSADGHWIVKLLGLSLLFQAYVAWIFREKPNLQVAKALAFYQIASASADWMMWLLMKDQGIFADPLVQVTIVLAIISHYLLGALLVFAIKPCQTRCCQCTVER